MTVRRTTSAGDWTFGKGRADYVARTTAIRQNVVTRLRSFRNDWFADVDAGSPWIEIFGQKSNRTRLIGEIERVVLATYGVRTIERLRITGVDVNRVASVELSFTDIFDQTFNETVEIP